MSPSPTDPFTALSRRFPRGAAALTLILAAGLLALFLHQAREHHFRNDDAYISFRYARHLADGLGLVWNPGERVEGYTNFLWVLIVSGAMKLGLRAEPFADVFSPLCGIALLGVVAAFLARRVGWRNPWILSAPAILVCSRSFTGWATSGMETMLFALLAFSSWARFLVERDSPVDRRRWSAWLFAAAALTRPDGILFAGVAGLLALRDTLARRITPRAFLTWAVPIVGIVGTHFLWRRAYYGFWWPNTAYAKVNAFHPEQGWRYFGEFHRVYEIAWFLPLLILVFFARPRGSVPWLLAPVALYATYLLAIGGDTFEFRFVVFLLPFLCVLLTEGLRRLATFRPRSLFAVVALVGLGLLAYTTWRGSDEERVGKLGRHQIRTFFQMNAVAEANLRGGRELRALLEDGTLPDDLVICLPTVGALPYLTGLVTIDYHGLNDVRIARMEPTGEGRLAHEHEASIDYLKERRVDMHLAVSRGLIATPTVAFRPRQKRFRPYWRDVPVGDRYLGFASYVSEERFLETFGHLLEEQDRRKRERQADR